MPSFAQDDPKIEKYLSTYKKWSTSMYEFDVKKQSKHLSPELSKRLSMVGNPPTTKEAMKCRSYLVSHSFSVNGAHNTPKELNLPFGPKEDNVELNVFNECTKDKSNQITHLSGITVNISTTSNKITHYQIKTHKNSKSGFSEFSIEKEFALFEKLTEKNKNIDLKNHDFSADIERLKNQ